MSQKDKKPFHVIYLGESGFPYGLAAIQKLIMISKALISVGAKVTVINRKGFFDPEKLVDIPLEGVVHGINYIYTSGTVYKPKSFFPRNIQKLRGIIKEFMFLSKLKKNNNLGAAIISCHHFGQTLLYRIYGWVLGFPIVLNYVEWASAMQHRKGWKVQINDYLFDNWLVQKMDGAFPISEVLIDNFKKIAPSKPQFKIPILCDYEEFNIPRVKREYPYFLYCGALVYREVVDFILEAFNQLPAEPRMDLYLILGGGQEEDLRKLEIDIKQLKEKDRVKIFRNIPRKDIPIYFKGASALLIPLRNTIQDEARFPHKIGEYVATGNPMIATNFGEVKHYFKDGENAFIADDYEVVAYAEKMKEVIENPKLAVEIGLKGQELCLQKFNYIHYGEPIKNFLEKM
ncbi:glycosyltransferase [Saprospiraceae bacterium]|nr:glycosyltransferase [Saprospiraceae bacterium]